MKKMYKTPQAKKLELLAREVDKKFSKISTSDIISDETKAKKIQKFFTLIEQIEEIFEKHIKNL